MKNNKLHPVIPFRFNEINEIDIDDLLFSFNFKVTEKNTMKNNIVKIIEFKKHDKSKSLF